MGGEREKQVSTTIEWGAGDLGGGAENIKKVQKRKCGQSRGKEKKNSLKKMGGWSRSQPKR